MNKPLHYALVGGLVLFIGLYIPFHILGDSRGSSAFTKATDYAFTAKSNPNSTFSSSFRTAASDSYFTSARGNASTQSTTWSTPSHSSMAMPLNFNTFEWKASAPKAVLEQDFGGTFIAAAGSKQTTAHYAAVMQQPQRSAAQRTAATAVSAQATGKDNAPAAMRAPRYTAHQSSVQEPFSNELPSESNTSFAGSTPDGISNRKNGFIIPSDPGDISPESPVGEPWIMLIFAAAAAAIITLRKRLQKAQA